MFDAAVVDYLQVLNSVVLTACVFINDYYFWIICCLFVCGITLLFVCFGLLLWFWMLEAGDVVGCIGGFVYLVAFAWGVVLKLFVVLCLGFMLFVVIACCLFGDCLFMICLNVVLGCLLLLVVWVIAVFWLWL